MFLVMIRLQVTSVEDPYNFYRDLDPAINNNVYLTLDLDGIMLKIKIHVQLEFFRKYPVLILLYRIPDLIQ